MCYPLYCSVVVVLGLLHRICRVNHKKGSTVNGLLGHGKNEMTFASIYGLVIFQVVIAFGNSIHLLSK